MAQKDGENAMYQRYGVGVSEQSFRRNWRKKKKKMVIRTAMRMMTAKKPKPKMKPIDPKTPPVETQTISRAIFDVVREHGPLTIAQAWERIQGLGLKELTSKTQMKTLMRWMRERQKLRLICDHVGGQKQFLYTTWFTKPNVRPLKPTTGNHASKLVGGRDRNSD